MAGGFIRPEAGRIKNAESVAVVSKKGRQISGMGRMRAALRVIVGAGFLKGGGRTSFAKSSLVEMETENPLPAGVLHVGKTSGLRRHEGTLEEGIKIDDSVNIRIFVAAVQEGVGLGRRLEEPAKSRCQLGSHDGSFPQGGRETGASKEGLKA